MNVPITRRGMLKGAAAVAAVSTLSALGFGALQDAVAEVVRPFKIARAKETRSNCPYCSVSCGLLMYSEGDGAKNARPSLIHVEGDPDHPVNRGTLCPKGAALLDFVHSDSRTKYPLYRAPGSNAWERKSWDWTLDRIARLLKDDRDRHFIAKNAEGQTVNRWLTTGFLAASASTNETGYITNKVVRSMGAVVFDNQARICHAPSVASLGPSFGHGAMTNTWMDIKNANLILVMGGNPAEAHPCGFKWVVEAKADNRARLVVVDPRFSRTASVADFYCPIRPGTDIAFLNGVTRHLLETGRIQHEYVSAYSNAGYLVREGFDFHEGLFTGYDAAGREYDTSTWEYEIGPDGYAVVDATLQHPRCVMQLLRTHVAPYTPEMVERICGSPRDKFLKICDMIAETSATDKVMTSLYALGWTQHSSGSQNIRGMCVVQTLLGNMGLPGGGINALRGHSNIQGLTDLGLLSELLPGYLDLPMDGDTDLANYLSRYQYKPLRPGQAGPMQGYRKYFVSLLKATYGDAATAANDFAYDYLPKRDLPAYDIMMAMELASQGKITGYIAQGFNALMSFPDQTKMREVLGKLKFLIVMNPLQIETARFWENHGVYNDADPASIQTEVFELPTTCFAEDEGSLTDSCRWLQWHWPAQKPPAETRRDIDIMAGIFLRVRELYRKEGGAFPDPILNLNWGYDDAASPRPEEIAREINGQALRDFRDEETGAVIRAGRQLDGFTQLKDDGSTSCGCWLYSGCFTEKGNMMARRDATDPNDRGIAPNWAWAWPANRRILYNRASADPHGNPWNEANKLVWWNGRIWTGYDAPDYPLTVPPQAGLGPFIMNEEGSARLFVRTLMRDGPFPVHYEPFETPRTNLLSPDIKGNPVSRIFKDDLAALGTSAAFPCVATSYRTTEHFNSWTIHSHINAILQPEQYVEIGEQLAREKGIANGGWVRVWSKRGELKAKAVVTKRVRPLICDGKPVHIVGLLIHWGFTGLARKGWSPNALTPVVGDADTQTPAYKAWLVNIEPTAPPPAMETA